MKGYSQIIKWYIFSKIPTRIYNMRSHVGTAFRDTGLSNVWQLGATLDNFARSRPPQAVEGVNHLTFPNLSQTISNYQPTAWGTLLHWRRKF